MPYSPREIKDHYATDGFAFPIDILAASEAAKYRAELEALEAQSGDSKLGNKSQLNYPHVIFKFAAEIAHNPVILDVVEKLIGPNILLWGTTFFIKEPHTDSHVSWHQDLKYWGLDDKDGQVSAWLALSPVTRANGCMRFLAGSHANGLVDHNDTFSDDNFLTRGQEADADIDEDQTTYVELAPGQASFHHGHLLHASAPNHSDKRRIGMVMNYIAPHVKQIIAPQDFAMLVRGQDTHGNFQHVPAPTSDFSKEALLWHARILDAQNHAMYDGADQKS